MTKEVILMKSVVINVTDMRVEDLYKLYESKKLVTMPEWLQRLRQTSKWNHAKGLKARSFNWSFFNGNSVLTSFYIIAIDILREHLVEELEYEKSKYVKMIYEGMLRDIDQAKTDGAEYVLADGQNRLAEAIAPFFESRMISNHYEQPFIFQVDGKEIFMNDFKFCDLDEEIKDAFRNTPVIVAKGMAGDIKSFIQSIVALNDGEPWTKFESAIIQQAPLPHEINKDIFRDGIIQSLFGNELMSGIVSGMSSKHSIEKKGDARYIAESVYMISRRCSSGIGSEDNLCSMLTSENDETLHAYKKVKSYLTFIANHFDSLKKTKLKESFKPLNKESLRGLIIMLDIMLNKDNIGHHNSLLQLRSLNQFTSAKSILEEFVKWHNKMNDKIANPDDFEQGVAKPGTYSANVKGSNPPNILIRIQHITDYINNNCKEWVEKSYIKDVKFDYEKSKVALLERSNYKDPYKKTNNDISLNMPVSIDHVVSRKGSKKGPDTIDNLLVTNPVSNSIKSNRY